jgi:hypothetical protein
MTERKQALANLREQIAGIIAGLETWNTLEAVRDALGLPYVESNGESKYNHLLIEMAQASDDELIRAAKRMLEGYPGSRSKPSETNLRSIQDDLWWVESDGLQTISKVTRYRIADMLEAVRFWGRFSTADFFAPVLPSTAIPFFAAGNDRLYQEAFTSLADVFALGRSGPRQVQQVSVVESLKALGFPDWPDQRFSLLLERLVDPEVQPPQIQQRLVAEISNLLHPDGFEMRQEGVQGGLPVFKVRRKNAGVSALPKYIIFASTGPKPDIVLDDAVSMDIRVVNYGDQCLVYDQPPPGGDLTWEMLVEWWARANGPATAVVATERALYRRLVLSLQSDPEKLVMDTYYRVFKPRLGEILPALLPQVYLHYDPRTITERGKPVLVRQRMDFLMLLRNAARIVIEVDGVQHYADEGGRAVPSRYAEMVAEDRRIKLLGYEVFRFGGAEFVDEQRARRMMAVFFARLFAKHGIRLPSPA